MPQVKINLKGRQKLQVTVIAPGRVNLIGEHTDYNLGYVLPAATEQRLTLSAQLKGGDTVTAYAEQFQERAEFNLKKLVPVAGKPYWVDYLRAVCYVLLQAGYAIKGADIAVSSNIPIGAGLSSSAAFEMAAIKALAHLNGHKLNLTEMVFLGQKAENDFVGVRCGIMDQFAVTLGQKDRALLLDCQNLHYEHIPLDLNDHLLLIVDSRVKRTLGDSAYNQRREECEAAVRIISEQHGQAYSSLRQVSLELLHKTAAAMPGELYMRSRFVLEENDRVLDASAFLKKNDLAGFGQLMYLSHQGLRDLFQVSCPELDLIVDSVLPVTGVLGARLTGAGFGGCAILLLQKDALNRAKQAIDKSFAANNLLQPLYYPTKAAAGLRFSD